MKRLAAALALIALACEAPQAPPAAAKKPEQRVPGLLSNDRVDFDTDNLLSLARGASVVDRSAELSFVHSAAQAIDGEWPTTWMSPGGAVDQTLTFALAARSRIRRVGVTPGMHAMQQLRIEASLDGASWSPVTTLDVKPQQVPQFRDVKPFEAQYFRVTPLAQGKRYATIGSVHAVGEEIAPPHAQPIEGCWTINGEPARFERIGAYLRGTIGPQLVEGGFDGRVAKLMWRRRAQFGYMMLTVTPDGRGISGMQWHEEVGHDVAGDGWIGTRSDCAITIPNTGPVRERLLEKRNRWNLYGLAFDAGEKLDEAASAPILDRIRSLKNIRITAREFRFSPEENRRRAQARLDALAAKLGREGITYVNVADKFDGRATTTVTQKVMIGSVDVER